MFVCDVCICVHVCVCVHVYEERERELCFYLIIHCTLSNRDVAIIYNTQISKVTFLLSARYSNVFTVNTIIYFIEATMRTVC